MLNSQNMKGNSLSDGSNYFNFNGPQANDRNSIIVGSGATLNAERK